MSPALPRLIWTLWLQGWEEAPQVARACARSWERANSSWTIRRVSAGSLSEELGLEIESRLLRKLPPEAVSDIVRIELLRRYGGMWVDATTYCLQPLDSWLPSRMASDFFAFGNPGPDRMISSWFLAAVPGSALIDELHRRVRRFWRDRTERDDYFWFHRLFEEAYEENDEFRRLWDATPSLPARPPHRFAPYERNLLRAWSTEDEAFVAAPQTPVLKLTHKLSAATIPSGSVLGTLIDRAGRPAPTPRRSLLATRRPRRSPRVLVTWYGSIRGHGTVGDLLAAQAVTGRLNARGYDFAHVSSSSSSGMLGRGVDLEDVDPDSVDILLFVCGPVLRNHPVLDQLLGRFEQAGTVGVGVSLLGGGSDLHIQPFDRVLAVRARLVV